MIVRCIHYAEVQDKYKPEVFYQPKKEYEVTAKRGAELIASGYFAEVENAKATTKKATKKGAKKEVENETPVEETSNEEETTENADEEEAEEENKDDEESAE